jgi:DNA polymerase-1
MSPPDKLRLFLVDGYALIYRAFFAMMDRPLRTSRGENTSAVWGVANFLHRLLEQEGPSHLAWVHDAGTSFRNEVFPDYKATREKLDENLQEDFDRSVVRIQQLLHGFRIPLIAVAGFEADDVIGTLARKASEASVQTIIVSGDKDFYQLISRDIWVLNPGRGGPAPVSESLVGLPNAAERFGVPPDRVVDYLALVGDSSDNVPGVKGIGDKTARALIGQYGDLDSILASAQDVKGKRAREGLLQYADQARLSRELVTIRRDVPVELDLASLSVREPDREALSTLYAALEFKSLVRRIGERRTRATAVTTEVSILRSPAELPDVVRQLREGGLVGLEVAVESPSARWSRIVGLGLALGDGRCWYLPLSHRLPDGELSADGPPINLPGPNEASMRPIKELLEDPSVSKAGHDVKRAWLYLRAAGVNLSGVRHDSMLASFVLEPGRRSDALEELMQEHLAIRLQPYEELVGKGKSQRRLSEIGVARAAGYCCARGAAALQLLASFDARLDETAGRDLLDTIEIPLIGTLVDMEWRGIGVDLKRLSEISRRFSSELREIEESIYREAGVDFNINSTPQLRHILFEKLQLPTLKRTKTGPSTAADVLGQLAAMGFEVPRLLLSYRELSKLKSTYVDTLPSNVAPHTGRVHTSFNQSGAATGRLSSSDPNLQNIPVRTPRGESIRECFVPAGGCQFIVADYSQIELRVLAHLSEDSAFIEAFKRGGDVHRETAAVIFDVPVHLVTPEMRARAKTINFATIYGQGPFALARQLGVTQDEAKEFIRLYFTRFAGVRRFLDELIENARRDGYVETMFGRRRYIPEVKDSDFNVRAFGERTAMNSPIQGSAADLMKIAMVNLARSLSEARMETAILLQVHDELVLESSDSEIEHACTIVRREMERAASLKVPLVVDVGVGPNWLKAKA